MRFPPILVAFLACGISVGSTQPLRIPPRPAQPDQTTGWCPRTIRPRPQLTRTLEVSTDLETVRPLRKDGLSWEEIGSSRDDLAHSLYGGLATAIVGGKLRLSSHPSSCHDTGAGCHSRYWERPAQLQLEEPVSANACVTYSIGLAPGMVVGLGSEMRVYAESTGRWSARKPIATPALEAIEMIEGRAILQEPSGRLWEARGGSAAPTLGPSKTTLNGRALAISRPSNGLVYAFTDKALYLLGKDTLAIEKQIDGEIWSVMSQDVPLHHFVLSVERGAKTRVILRELDATGAVLRTANVYEGPVSAAHLGRGSDTFVVHIAT
jgi:hypothetical protein